MEDTTADHRAATADTTDSEIITPRRDSNGYLQVGTESETVSPDKSIAEQCRTAVSVSTPKVSHRELFWEEDRRERDEDDIDSDAQKCCDSFRMNQPVSVCLSFIRELMDKQSPKITKRNNDNSSFMDIRIPIVTQNEFKFLLVILFCVWITGAVWFVAIGQPTGMNDGIIGKLGDLGAHPFLVQFVFLSITLLITIPIVSYVTLPIVLHFLAQWVFEQDRSVTLRVFKDKSGPPTGETEMVTLERREGRSQSQINSNDGNHHAQELIAETDDHGCLDKVNNDLNQWDLTIQRMQLWKGIPDDDGINEQKRKSSNNDGYYYDGLSSKLRRMKKQMTVWLCQGIFPMPLHIFLNPNKYQSSVNQWKISLLLYVCVLPVESLLYMSLWQALLKLDTSMTKLPIQLHFPLQFFLGLLASIPIVSYLVLPLMMNVFFVEWMFARIPDEKQNCLTLGFPCFQ